MNNRRQVCCGSPASIAYWFVVSLAAWLLLGISGLYWHPLRAYSAETILFAMAIGCIANWVRNRTLHCGITAPLFLILGFMSLLTDLRIMHLSSAVLWTLILVGVGAAFMLEWQYARRCHAKEFGMSKDR